MSPIPADGTVLRGAGAYAYVMANGKRCAVPDATTLRDLGRALDRALAPAPADLAAIPLGAPYPSASKFASPPPAQVPLLLLPVRLETAFSGNELLVRIFPDAVHVNSFEAALTADETAARAQYLAIAASDTAARKAAFGTLVRQFGTARAAYLGSGDATSATKAADWTIAPFTNVLPDRWIVLGYNGTAPGRVLAIGSPIADSLAVGPAPGGTGPASDPGIAWLRDFDAAVAAGMGVRVPLAAGAAPGFDKLVVLGLRSTLAAAEASARFASLLQAHHYSDGLALLPRDAATKNTDITPSAHSTADPDFETLFAIEQGPARCPARPTGDGDRLARALGIVPATFAHVSGADGGEDEQAAAMNATLWPATWGYYLEQLVTGAVPAPETTLPAVRDHFATHVRARGHYPALMMGRQPYGVLPVCWSANWTALQTDPVETQLAPLLTKVRSTWEQSLANVPRLSGASDVEAALVAVLGMTPSSTSYAARGTIGPEYAFTFFNFAKSDLNAAWWSALAMKTAADAATIGAPLAATRLANATYVLHPRSLGSELVADAPLAGQTAPAYVTELAAMGWQALRDATPPQSPAPLFFYLLRQAALRAYVDAAFDLLLAANAAQQAERIESELVGFDATRPDAWSVLARTLPGRGAVGSVLDGLKSDPTVPAFAAFWKAFGTLGAFSASDLDAALREAFDLASYRLDAWISSLAQSRLDRTRAANPNGGVVIGGYGWVEQVRPTTAAVASSGYINAPSVDRAATAAVLRSAYLAHAGEAGRPFSLDLSSRRVRLGLHLLDGMRSGQSLGALLGYRFERALHEAGLDRFIDAFRAVVPSDAASALDVVDGLALVRAFQTSPTFWNGAGLPASGTPERSGTTAALDTLAVALDAVADLTLAESVHQLTRGNTVRASATVDAIARGDAPPPEIGFVSTPRSGNAATYRVLSLALETTATGWASTPRAAAEPRLNAWAGTLLGDPSRVRLRVTFAAPAPVTVEFGFNELGLAPLDVLALPEALNGGPELAARILAAARAHRPAGVAPGAAASAVTERNQTWSAQTIGLAEWLVLARAAARMVNGARAVTPADFAGPSDTPYSVDTAELHARADTAESHLRAASAALAQSPTTEAALLDAASFGGSGAFPSAMRRLARAGHRRARRSLRAHGGTRCARERIRSDDRLCGRTGRARRRALAGDVRSPFVVIPAFVTAATASLAQLWADSVRCRVAMRSRR